MTKTDPKAEEIISTLKQASPDDMSPREAWQMLADLHEAAGKE